MKWRGSSFAFGQSIDVIAASVSAVVNPNGAFSYIRKTAATSTTAALLSYSGTPGRFIGPETFSLPAVTVTSGNIFLHPGSTSGAVGIRWTAPFSGQISLTGRFIKDTTTGTSDGVNVSVYKNNTIAVVAPRLINLADPIYQYNSASTSVIPGDTVDFLIDRNANFSSDHTNCTILQIVYN